LIETADFYTEKGHATISLGLNYYSMGSSDDQLLLNDLYHYFSGKKHPYPENSAKNRV
jgi:hypothetical protein